MRTPVSRYRRIETAPPAIRRTRRAVVALGALVAAATAACSAGRDSSRGKDPGGITLSLTSPVAGCLAVQAISDLRDVSDEFQVPALTNVQFTLGGLPFTTLTVSAQLYAGMTCTGTPLYVAAPVMVTLSPQNPQAAITLNFVGNGRIVIDGVFEGSGGGAGGGGIAGAGGMAGVAGAGGAGGGLEEFVRQFGTSDGDIANSVATGPAGNVYVAGYTGGTFPGQASSGGVDAFVRKHDTNGGEIWTRQFGTSASDYAISVITGPAGNVSVAGYTLGTFPGQASSGYTDAFVRKYGTNGGELWTRQFGTSNFDLAYSVTMDQAGNVFVVGYTQGTLPGQTSSGNYDAFVRKYGTNGGELWTRQFGTSSSDQAYSVTTDAAGNVFAAGYTGGTFPGQTNSGNSDAFVRKYDTNGTEIWTTQFGMGSTAAYSVTTELTGNVFVAGNTGGTLPGQTGSGNFDAFVRKYDTNGTEIWTTQLGTSGYDQAWSVTTDAAGNVFVAGNTGGTLPGQTGSGGADAFVRKYDTNGTELWTTQLGTSSYDEAHSVTTDAAGNVLLAGYTYGALPGQISSGGADAFVMRMAPNP